MIDLKELEGDEPILKGVEKKNVLSSVRLEMFYKQANDPLSISNIKLGA